MRRALSTRSGTGRTHVGAVSHANRSATRRCDGRKHGAFHRASSQTSRKVCTPSVLQDRSAARERIACIPSHLPLKNLMSHIPRNFAGMAAAVMSRVLAMRARAAHAGDAGMHASCKCSDPSDRDRALASGEAPPLGAHLVTPRRGYTHHGIYVGQGRVVQYAGLARGIRTGPVEEVSLAQFVDGHALRVRGEASPCFDGAEVVRRARCRIGENRYHLLTNNCEHFCEWCLCAEPRSYQVDEWLSRPSRALRIMMSSISMSYSQTGEPARRTSIIP
jgi:hypothetical protein